jgi:hypothetical protein
VSVYRTSSLVIKEGAAGGRLEVLTAGADLVRRMQVL